MVGHTAWTGRLPAVNFFQRISRALGRLDESLASTEASGGEARIGPALGQTEAAERREFPPEEFAAEEHDESE